AAKMRFRRSHSGNRARQLRWRQARVQTVSVHARRHGVPHGHGCRPLKLSEALACGVPVVAAGVGDVNEMLSAASQRYQPGNARDLALKLRHQLTEPTIAQASSVAAYDWQALAGDTAALLATCLQRPPG
ncbi:MAG: glycosyltransferase, partial [Stenotrophomonas sp.]